MSFVHLHVHSHYSLLNSSLRIEDMIARASETGMPAMALTDHGNLYGALEFYQKAKKAGVKPILGLDAYITHGPRTDRTRKFPNYRITLLAENNKGLENLFRLVTLSNFEGFYYKPRIDLEILAQYKQGLIALSGCLGGAPGRLLQDNQEQAAIEAVQNYLSIFGTQNYYLELVDTKVEAQQSINETFKKWSKTFSVPLVGSNNVHYLDEKDAKSHDVLMCIGSSKKVEDKDRFRFSSQEFSLKTPEQMAEVFKDCPEAIDNTFAIADRCNVDIDLKEYHMPVYDLPEGKTPEEELRDLTIAGLKDRMPEIQTFYKNQGLEKDIDQEYNARLEEELEIILGTGFSGYFLIVQDFINYAKNQGIPVGPGRGSAAGSLVAYALRITDVDPIPYNLLFERFLNKERISMPDIDVDFCQDGRDAVIRYVAKKYDGENNDVEHTKVAQITTFGKLQARAALRDVGRALGMTYGEVDRIAKLVPQILNISLKEAFEQEEKFDELRKEDGQVNELLDIAVSVEGLTRHASVHAAGVVISDDKPLVDHLPLSKGQHDEVVTQWDMKCVEKVGLVKFDFLGLKTLTLLRRACELIEESSGTQIDLLTLNQQDQKVFDLLSRGETQGVFQLESSGMRDLVVRLKPSSFEDIVALVALYRPGPLGSGMVDDFISRKHGRTSIAYELPVLEPILKDTYGVILYQEQVMQIASSMASYTLGEADLLRRAMGKKIAAEMDQQEERFMKGALENGFHKAKAKKIFDLMAKFAGYGFNKSHSAAYALISYQTAYLKTHYPTEFMAACLSIDKLNTDRVVKHLNDCRAQGIEVCPPNANESHVDFTVQEKKILFGLAAVKNVGEVAIAAALKERKENGPFKDLYDFCCRVDSRKVNKKVIESLIKCGAFDGFPQKRSQMMESVEKIIAAASSVQKDKLSGQNSLFGALEAETTLSFQYPEMEEWDETEKLNFERDTVGFYVSGHPLMKYKEAIDRYSNTEISKLKELRDKSKVRLGGMVVGLKEITTKKGKRMGFATLEDMTDQAELVVFSDAYAESVETLKSDEPVFVTGTVDIGEDQAKVLVEKVCSLEEASQLFEGQVEIRLDGTQTQKEDLEKLKVVMEKYRGAQTVVLKIQTSEHSETKVALSPKHNINPSPAFFLEAEKQLGSKVRMICV